MKYCPKCKMPVNDNAVYCPLCGVKMDEYVGQRKEEILEQNSEQKTQEETEKLQRSEQADKQDVQKNPSKAFNEMQTQIEEEQRSGQSATNQAYNGQIIASFIFGLLSIIFCSIPVVGLILGIIGLVLNRRSDKKLNYRLRKAGFVLPILGVIFSGIFTLAEFSVFSLCI